MTKARRLKEHDTMRYDSDGSRSKIERRRLACGGASGFHMWPQAPQNSIDSRRLFASMRTVLLDPHAWQFGTGCASSCDIVRMRTVTRICASRNRVNITVYWGYTRLQLCAWCSLGWFVNS